MESTSHLFLHINEENTPADCLFDAWRESTGPLFDTTAKVRTATYRADVAACMAGELFVSRVLFDPMVSRRGRRHLTHGDLDYYVLQLYVSGSERVYSGSTRYLFDSNTVCLRDWRYGYTGVNERNDIIGFAIPRHLLNTYGGIDASRPALLWPRASAAGTLLTGAILRTWQRLPHASAQEAATLAANLLDLLDGILANHLMGQSEELRINRAMLLTIKQYITDHLDDPALGVDLLCHRFRLSRASLYRMFQEEGGLQRHIREQRLRRCFGLLSNAGSSRLKVRDVAERWGFDDASHFNRLFKTTFGMAPSDLLLPPVNEPRPIIRDVRVIRGWAEGDRTRRKSPDGS